MKPTPANLYAHELIGLRVRITSSLQPSLEGLEGVVVDETMKTLRVATARGVRVVPKAESRLAFALEGYGWVELEGSRILGRPEDRIARLR